MIAIPVSLVGTFTILYVLGISLNNLSLFGLVLAVGIVVDDAIVVVENVERNIRSGMSALEAAHKTMDEVGSALISTALTLCAVLKFIHRNTPGITRVRMVINIHGLMASSGVKATGEHLAICERYFPYGRYP